MVKITGKRSDPVKKIINFALKYASTVIRNCVKTQNCHIQVPKNYVKIAQLLDVNQIGTLLHVFLHNFYIIFTLKRSHDL